MRITQFTSKRVRLRTNAMLCAHQRFWDDHEDDTTVNDALHRTQRFSDIRTLTVNTVEGAQCEANNRDCPANTYMARTKYIIYEIL